MTPTDTRARSGGTRRIRFVVLLAPVAGLLAWLLLGLVSIPENALGLLDSTLRDAGILEPGMRWRLPGLESITVLDPYVLETELDFRTPEGAMLGMSFRAALRPTPTRARELVSFGEGETPAERLDEAVGRIVTDLIHSSVTPGELPELDDDLRASVARTLEYYGKVEGDLVLEYGEDSPVTLALRAAEVRERVRELKRDTGTPVLVVGLDGADWQIAEPLIERGLLPNLQGLRERGAWGNIKALTPVLSPLLWTSVATGVTADRHGVLDFLIRDPSSGEMVPVNSRFRKVRALWNIFTDADLTSDVVAWWATWPAEEINGHLVSDRVAYSLFDFDLPTGGAGATHPASYLDQLRPLLVSDEEITYEEVDRFVDVTREEYDAGRARIAEDRASAFREPVNHLTKVLSSTRSYHRIALDLIGGGQSDLTAVYYQGIDEIGHRFMHFMAPRLRGVTEEDVRRYGGAVEEFYVYQDELLGELLSRVRPDTTVIVLSDHGFVSGADRPEGETADIEGKPGKWHRPYGILVIAGPPIVHRELDTTSLLDITPTTLYLAGLPVPEDTAGRVLEEAIRPEFRERFPESRIASYDTVPFRVEAAPRSEAVAAAEAEIVEKLRSLGYIGSGGDDTADAEAPAGAEGTAGTEAVTAHANLAAVLMSQGKLDEAEREILAALDMKPDFGIARRQLFTLRSRQKHYDEALEIAEGLIASPEELDQRFLARVAETYRIAGRIEDGIRRFDEGVRAGRWELGAALARLVLEYGDEAEADRIARAVLSQDPRNESAMVTVFRIAQSRKQLGSLEPLLEAALDKNPRSVMHLNWLAIVHESRGDMDRAEGLLNRALDANPDHGGSMANLGAFYSRHGRDEEAVKVLERALRIEPRNLDARINLGSALARMGKLREAIVEFERLVEGGVERPDIFNALARAHGQLGELDATEDWLRRSLEVDPEQDKVRETLARLEARGS